jgi:hypothetical protein
MPATAMSNFDMRRDIPLNPSVFRDHRAKVMLRRPSGIALSHGFNPLAPPGLTSDNVQVAP